MKKYLYIARSEIFGRLFFHLIYIAAIAALPYIIKNMIDCGFEHGMRDVFMWIAVFVACIIIGVAAQYITQKTAWKLDKKLYEALRQDLFSAVIRKKPDRFRSREIGDYSSMLINDVSACGEYVENIMEICESVIGFVTYAVYILLLDIRIAIIIYAAAGVMMFLPKLTGKKLSLKKQTLLERTGIYTTRVLDLLRGYPMVSRDTYGNISNRHKQELEQMEEARYDYGKFKTFANTLNGSVMYVIDIAAFAIIAVLLFRGNITVGVATATIAYIQDFVFPLRTMIDSVSNVKSVTGAKDAIMEEVKEPELSEELPISFEKEIRLEQVCFSYKNFTLRDFSYVFEKGKHYAIVGESGKGKSTILNLITGNLTPDSGKILIDGREISYDLCSSLMFYVNQQSHVFMESFLDNTTVFGSFDEKKTCHDYIPEEKQGYMLQSSDCSNMSGGEKQLVSLIRAVMSERSVLILDEPFSALDKKTEWMVCEKLLEMKDKTILMITHNEQQEFLQLFDEVLLL